MDEFFQAITERHPWLVSLRLGSSEAGPFERIPASIPLLLSAIEAVARPLCFVLPRCGNVPRYAAIFAGLAQVRKKGIEGFDPGKFALGDRVRVLPSKHVFLFDGLREDDPSHFMLRELNARRWLDLPLRALARLERTTRTQPVGHLEDARELRNPSAAPIDQLLDLSTQGNLGVFGTLVVVLDSRAGFSEMLGETFLSNSSASSTPASVGSLLPVGDAHYDFDARKPWTARWGETDAAAPPLIAVCSRAEELAAFCHAQPQYSQLVVVNGAILLRTPQHYYDIADSQRLVIFASHDETETLEWLKQTGCDFWELGAAELQHGVEGALFEPIAQWAANHACLDTIELSECGDEALERAAVLLVSAQHSAQPENDTPAARVIGRGWHLLNDVASWVAPPPDTTIRDFAHLLGEMRAGIRRDAQFISAHVREILMNSAELLETAARGVRVGRQKGDALIQCVGEEVRDGKRVAVLVRSETAVGPAKELLGRIPSNRAVQVIPIRALPEDQSFDCLVVASWPGGDVLRRAAAKLVAPRIKLVGYGFERGWAKHAERRLLPHTDVPNLSTDRKSEFAFGRQSQRRWPEYTSALRPVEPPKQDFDVWRWEGVLRGSRPPGAARREVVFGETIVARYVRFVGECFAFMTEGHSLPIVTNLLSGGVSKSAKLPERCVAEWHASDFVVFPESGDRSLVRDVADKLLGRDAAVLRQTSQIWKDALRRSRMPLDEFETRARRVHCTRHSATIRNWFSDSAPMGPDSEEDLRIIATATGDETLLRNQDAVWSALQEIWGAHQSAGKRLRDELKKQLPAKLSELHETATQVDLGDLGTAWIVMVEEVAMEPEPRTRNEADRLRWPDGSEPELL